MAESSTGEKSEKASQQKLKKARSEGQVARSKDGVTAVSVVAGLYLVAWLVPGYLQDFRQLFAYSFSVLDGEGTLDNAWSMLFLTAALLLLKLVAPLLCMPVLLLLTSLVPGGWVLLEGHRLRRGPAEGEKWVGFEEMQRIKRVRAEAKP